MASARFMRYGILSCVLLGCQASLYCFQSQLIRQNFAECSQERPGTCVGYCAECVSQFSRADQRPQRSQLLVVEAFITPCDRFTDPEPFLLAARLQLGNALKAKPENIQAYMGIDGARVVPDGWLNTRRLRQASDARPQGRDNVNHNYSVPTGAREGDDPGGGVRMARTEASARERRAANGHALPAFTIEREVTRQGKERLRGNTSTQWASNTRARVDAVQRDSARGARRLSGKPVIGDKDTPSPLVLAEEHTCYLDFEGQVRCWGWESRGRLGHDTAVEGCCQPTSQCCAQSAVSIDFGKELPNVEAGVRFIRFEAQMCPSSGRYGSYTYDEALIECAKDPQCGGVYDNMCDNQKEVTLCFLDAELQTSQAGSCVYKRHDVVLQLGCENCSYCGIETVITNISPIECLQRCIDDQSCFAVDIGKGTMNGECKIKGAEQECFTHGMQYDSYRKVPGRKAKIDAIAVNAEPCFAAEFAYLTDGVEFTTFGGDGCSRYFNNWWIVFNLKSIFQMVAQVELVLAGDKVVKYDIGTCETTDIASCSVFVTCEGKYFPYATEFCVFEPIASRYWLLRVRETQGGFRPLIAEVSFYEFQGFKPIQVSRVAAGLGHSCAIIRGRVKCWGRNDAGQSAPQLKSAVVVKDQPFLTIESMATHVAVSQASTCVVSEGGALTCFGSNVNGELGTTRQDVVMTTRNSDLDPRDVIAGHYHFCSIHGAERRLVCWGKAENGQLGTGDVFSRPAFAESTWVRLANGDLLENVNTAGAGNDFTCALVSGTVYCWGGNDSGQLGLGHFDSSPTPKVVLSNVEALGVGSAHACALGGDGWMSCWGNNDNGQLGLQDNISRALPKVVLGNVTGLSVGGSSTCAFVDSELTPYCWGRNREGSLGVGRPGTNNLVDQDSPRRITLPGLPASGRAWMIRLHTPVQHLLFYADRSCTIHAPPTRALAPGDLASAKGVMSIIFPLPVEIRCISFSPSYKAEVERWDGNHFTNVPFDLGADGKLRMPIICVSTADCKYGTCRDGFCHCSDGYTGVACDTIMEPVALSIESNNASVRSTCGGDWCTEGYYCSKHNACALVGTCGGYVCGWHGNCIDDDCICEEGWAGITCERQISTQSDNSCQCQIYWQDPFGLGRCAGPGNMGCCSPDKDPETWCMDTCGHWRYCTTLFWCQEDARLDTDWRKCSRVPQCYGHEEFFCCPADPEAEGLAREPCCPEQKCEANEACVQEGWSEGDCCPMRDTGVMLDCCNAVKDTSIKIANVETLESCKLECLNDVRCQVFEHNELTSECFISFVAKRFVGWLSRVGGQRTLCEPRPDMCIRNTKLTCEPHGACITKHHETHSEAECECAGGWTGTQCDVDPCKDVECSTHGQCDGLTKTCVCDIGWSDETCGTVGTVNVGSKLVFDPPFTAYTFGALGDVARKSLASVVANVHEHLVQLFDEKQGDESRRRTALLDNAASKTNASAAWDSSGSARRRMAAADVLEKKIRITKVTPDSVEYMWVSLTSELLEAAQAVRPKYFSLTLLGQLCADNGISISTPTLEVIDASAVLTFSGIHVLFVIDDSIADVDINNVKNIVGWNDANMQALTQPMRYQTMDSGSGGVGKAALSEGQADPDTVRSWIGDRSVSGTADIDVLNPGDANSDGASFTTVLVIACSVLFVVVFTVFGFLYYKKKGLFARYAKTSACPIGKVYSDERRASSQRDAENPRTPGNARFLKRTSPEEEDSRTSSKNNNYPKHWDSSGSPADERSFRRPKSADASDAAEYPHRRATYANGDPFPREDVNFSKDARTECRKKQNEKDEREERRKRAWEEPDDAKGAEQEDAKDTEQEGANNSKEAPPEEQEKSGEKSYRHQKRRSQGQKEPKPEPEAEPQGPGPTDYSSFNKPQGRGPMDYRSFNKQCRRDDLRRMSAPVVPDMSQLPDISKRESVERLGPRLAGSDLDEVSKKICAWMTLNRPQNFEVRKKAFRNLTLMWHPDKNADSLEAAKVIFQLLQSKKEYFLKE